MKKLLATLTIVLPLLPAAVFGASFSDLPNTHWAFDAVAAVSEKGIVNGYPDGAFKPSGTVTYGEFIKMAYIAQGGEELAADGSDWALPYYEASVESLLFTQHDISKNALSHPIPREYAALILSRVLGEIPIENADAVKAKLTDIGQNAHESDIVKVRAAGLITGYPDRTFRPAGTLTRAEAATVIHRLLEEGERLLPDLRPASEKTPLERLLDAPEEGTEGLGPLYDVIDGSASTRPISEVLDDVVGNDGSVNDTVREGFEQILYYEIFEDFPYQMKITHNLVGQERLVLGYKEADGFLIKDRKVIANTHSGTHNGEAILSVRDEKYFPDFDYIGVTAVDSDILLLIPNNLVR
jgi:hypothetical protein